MNPSTLQFANRRSSVNRINHLVAGLALLTLAACSGGATPTTFTNTYQGQLTLKFDSQPPSGLAGEALPVKVSIRDANGQLVGGGGTVTIALAANEAGAALVGTATRTAVGGVATF